MNPSLVDLRSWGLFCPLLAILVLLDVAVRADDKPPAEPAEVPFAKQQFQPPSGLRRAFKDHDIWIDTKRKRVIIDGVVTLREGQLEMFACPRQTKEHESVVAVNCTAKEAHAGLLLVGARSGRPARFDPVYSPATGSIIDIMILWHDEAGKKQSARAQDWVRNVKTGKAMKYDWVFAGSGVWVDPDNGERFYHADAGDFICVSNFPSATLDLPVESPQANASLLFESFTKNIPAKGTPVRLVLTPRPPSPKEKPAASGDPADNAEKKKQVDPATDKKKAESKKPESKKPESKKPDGDDKEVDSKQAVR